MAVSSQFYSAKDGDMLDQVVRDHYGDVTGGKVEAVLDANPRLAALGPILSAGQEIELPDLSDANPDEVVTLWT